MKKINYFSYEAGRRFMVSLPHKGDVLHIVSDFCIDKKIHTASFSIIGAVSSAVFGLYDQKQQVYATKKQEGSLEIISCTGNVTIENNKPFVHAHILLGNDKSEIFGGHLFSETIVFAGELDITELLGDPIKRAKDTTTGLMLFS